jgi:hypothetical protein
MARFLMALIGCSLVGLVGLQPRGGMAQTQFVPGDDSRVWIEGTSTVNDFTCSTQQIEGRARLALDEPSPRSDSTPDTSRTQTAYASSSGNASSEPPAIQASVPVRTLDCGKRRQNRDLYDAMQASEHPAIHYEIVKTSIVALPDSSRSHYVIEAIGDLTIAGATRTVRLRLQGRRLENGQMHARGTLPIQMTDFNVEPPTAMLGLIRVRDEITVHFDITAVPADRP